MTTDIPSLAANLALGTLMGILTVLIHFWGLLYLTHMMRRHRHRLRPMSDRTHQSLVLLIVVFGIFVLHTLQIWSYAVVYVFLGEFGNFEAALYFSTSAFTTVGFGDIVMSPRWRVLSAIESANGWILFAWSTAFLLTVTTRLKLLEHEWLEGDD
ncbi:MAG: ion channel [Gammaproteobacteria bacterium]